MTAKPEGLLELVARCDKDDGVYISDDWHRLSASIREMYEELRTISAFLRMRGNPDYPGELLARLDAGPKEGEG